ncbi:MAG TPA: helix-turn-helix domain-containing protein [Planctomycetota bacterium]|nr:helix-turn-helix domain-containing protein [Planctomycetota bacterium]
MPRTKPRVAAPRPAQANESLISGLELLQALAGAASPVGSREMARLLDMEHTRVSRLMGTLAHMGLAERTAERKYAPGPGLHVLAAMSLRGSRLLSAALPHLEALRTGLPDLAVALGVLWRRQVVYVYFATPGEDPRVAVAGRDLYPAEKSSIGRVLLAAQPRSEVRKLYAGTPRAELDGLLGALDAAARDGWALYENTTLGVAVGEPPVAGLAVAGKLAGHDRDDLVRRLRETAERISQGLLH